MFALSAENSFHLYSHPTDMRKSLDALSGLVRNNPGSDPANGELLLIIGAGLVLLWLAQMGII